MRPYKYDLEYLTEKLKEASVILGGSVSRRDLITLNSFPSCSTYEKYFKGWSNALKKAGLPIKKNGAEKRYSINGKYKRLHASLKTRFLVLQRDLFTCQYCGRKPQDGIKLEVDHINPKSNGGTWDMENLITSCFECNHGKRDVLIINPPKKRAEPRK